MYATPHRDPMFRDEFFLTVTVSSGNHRLGELNKGVWGIASVPRGCLFVVDPRKTHRLFIDDPQTPSLWVGMQWTVPRKQAPEVVRAIVERFKGQWASDEEAGLYKDWKTA